MPENDRRLVISGLDARGKSVWVHDGPAKKAAGTTGLYQITKVPADVRGEYPPTRSETFPDLGSVWFRIIEFRPHSGGSGVGMHASNTIDILTVVSGEVWCHQEDDKEGKLLKQGDTIIQRGTMHAWENKGDQPCVCSCFLISATGGLAPELGTASLRREVRR